MTVGAPGSARRGRPRDPARLERVLQTATAHFQTHGFEGTSLDAIARDSGVSKVTIYSYFPSKEALYGECICTRTEADVGEELFASLDPLKPKASLLRVGRQFLKLLRADEVIGKHRSLYSQALPQQQLAEQFYENGPLKTVQRLEHYLQLCHRAGSLRIPQASLAAEQFFALFLGLGHMRCLMGLGKPAASADERLLKGNVETFMGAYGEPAPPKRQAKG